MQPAFRSGNARLALHTDELGGFHRQRRVAGAKSLGDHFLGLVEVLAGIHQVGGCPHGLRSANRLKNGAHRIGMRQNIFAGVHCFAGDQRLRKGARSRHCIGLLGQLVGRRLHDSCWRCD